MAIDTAELTQPIFRNTALVPAPSDRIWRGEIEHAVHDIVTDTAPAPANTTIHHDSIPEPQTTVYLEDMPPLDVSQFVGRALNALLSCQSPAEAVDYLDCVGDVAQQGEGQGSVSLPQQAGASQSEPRFTEIGTDAWIRQIRLEASDQGIQPEEHLQYPAYRLRMNDLAKLGWLADALESNADTPGYIPYAIEMYLRKDSNSPDVVRPTENIAIAWRGSNDLAVLEPEWGSSAIVNTKQQEDGPDGFEASSDTMSLEAAFDDRLVDVFAKYISTIGAPDIVTARYLWDSRRLPLDTLAGFREMVSTIYAMGKLVLGSDDMAGKVSRVAVEKHAQTFVERGLLISSLRGNKKTDLEELRGGSHTRKGYELSVEQSKFLHVWTGLLKQFLAIDSKQLERYI